MYLKKAFSEDVQPWVCFKMLEMIHLDEQK